MRGQKGIATSAILAALVLLAGVGAGAYVLINRAEDNSANQTNNSQTTTQTPEDKNSTNQNKQQSISEINSSGKPLKCNFTYSGANGNADAVMYSNGSGNSRIDIAATTEKGNTGTNIQIIKDGKSYTIVESNGKKIAFSFDLANITTESANTNSNQGIPPNVNFDMTCENWDVDSSVFEIPSDAQFLNLPTLPS